MDPLRRPLWRSTDVRQARLSRLDAATARAEEVATTGLKVLRPSDAPGRWGAIGAIRGRAADQPMFRANLSTASVPINVGERALGDVSNLLSAAKALAVQTSSETVDSTRRTATASQVDALRAQLVGLANTRAGNRYIFAGDQYDTPAFDAAGAYIGGTGSPSVWVGEDRWLETAWSGANVFQGSVDAFQVLDDLSTALSANDAGAVAGLLSGLDAAFEQAVRWRQDAGLRQEVLDDAAVVSENLETLFSDRLNDLVGEDPATAFTNLAEARNAYTSALQITATAGERSLFDYLR